MHSKSFRTLLTASLCLTFAACANTTPPTGGRLVIVGGGLLPDNGEVIRAFIAGAGESIVVLPTASEVPKESGPGTVEDLMRWAEAGQTARVVEILATTPERATDDTYVGELRSANAVWFTGGVQSRILAVFRPDGIDARAYDAVVDVLHRGGRVGGTSAGAAMMSDPMIAGGSSLGALLHGVGAEGVELERGMGFFPYGLVDQHFLRRGRIARLVVAMEAEHLRFGYGIADNRALEVDLQAHVGRPRGERAVLCIDLADMQRSGASRTGFRVALLSSGDTIDLQEGIVSVAAQKHPVAPSSDPEPRRDEELQPFGAETVTLLIERLSRDPAQPQSASADGVTLTVRADERTRFVAHDEALDGFSAAHVLMDLVVTNEAASSTERSR